MGICISGPGPRRRAVRAGRGEYRPVAAAAAGSTFVMTEPFAFAVDPAALLDGEAPDEIEG
ncbi:hypothetical protein [Micromonospora deserti]|uniref:hypothetical protein n=1 Tax=Micromonospora deserti TaxID=2070366 RepID=UPI0011B59F90|nr:hypothetical protein [Micromonospora deserti]